MTARDRARDRHPGRRRAASAATGELGELSVGAVGDVAVWKLDGPIFAGVLDDPIEGWLRCGPPAARDTIVHGRAVVRDGRLVSTDVGAKLAAHRVASRRFQPARLTSRGAVGPGVGNPRIR